MSKVQDAVSAFESGFNCSQAIVRTYGPDYGLSLLDSVRVSCGFGGGMRRGDTCGAVTGALMVLGLRFGTQDASDTSARAAVYSKVDEFQSRFESRCDFVARRDLLGCDISTPQGMEHATRDNLFKTVCPRMVFSSLQGHKAMVLATSSYAADASTVLGALGFDVFFPCMIAKDDVEHIKPHPEIFLRAAGRMAAAPQQCIVIEDAEKGVLAAHAAGMKCIAVPNEHTADNDFSRATLVVDSLEQIDRELIDRL